MAISSKRIRALKSQARETRDNFKAWLQSDMVLELRENAFKIFIGIPFALGAYLLLAGAAYSVLNALFLGAGGCVLIFGLPLFFSFSSFIIKEYERAGSLGIGVFVLYCIGFAMANE